MNKTYIEKIIKRKPKFQETVVGIIILGLITSAIWALINKNKERTLTNKNELTNNIISNSDILQGNKIKGDIVGGNKVISSENKLDREKDREYVFINNLCAIIAIADNNEKVLAYSITTLNFAFTPRINLQYMPLEFVLGKTKFVEIEESLYEPTIYGMMGANWFHYNEEYYLARPGNYQTYIFSVNENGLLDDYFQNHPPFFINEEFREEKKQEMVEFRKNVSPNTVTITSPLFDTMKKYKDYIYGPQRTQINMLTSNINSYSNKYLLDSIAKLYPESNVNFFIELFGEPNFINEINAANN